MKPQDMTPGCKYIRKKPVVYIPSKFEDYTFCDTPVVFVKIHANGSPVFKQPAECDINLKTATITNHKEKYYILPLEFADDNWIPFKSATKKYNIFNRFLK